MFRSGANRNNIIETYTISTTSLSIYNLGYTSRLLLDTNYVNHNIINI